MGGRLSRLFHHEVRLIMVGLDGAGKTSILYKLKLGENVNTIPTIGQKHTTQYTHAHAHAHAHSHTYSMSKCSSRTLYPLFSSTVLCVVYSYCMC